MAASLPYWKNVLAFSFAFSLAASVSVDITATLSKNRCIFSRIEETGCVNGAMGWDGPPAPGRPAPAWRGSVSGDPVRSGEHPDVIQDTEIAACRHERREKDASCEPGPFVLESPGGTA